MVIVNGKKVRGADDWAVNMLKTLRAASGSGGNGVRPLTATDADPDDDDGDTDPNDAAVLKYIREQLKLNPSELTDGQRADCATLYKASTFGKAAAVKSAARRMPIAEAVALVSDERRNELYAMADARQTVPAAAVYAMLGRDAVLDAPRPDDTPAHQLLREIRSVCGR